MKNSTKVRLAGVVNATLGLIVWFVPAVRAYFADAAPGVAAILLVGAILPQFIAHKLDRTA